SNHDQNASQHQAPNGVEIGSGTFQGQAAVTVSATSGVSVQLDKNGNVTSITVTTVTAYFGTGNNAGQFLGAESTSTTHVPLSGADPVSTTTPLNFGQATRVMGADRMALGPQTASGDILTHFPGAVASDVQAHPAAYLIKVGEAASLAIPVGEAYEGVKAVVDVAAAAADFVYSLAH
ncbi:MAG TPA: hypothetical protein VN788_01800, partial [Verrucomicrobiae bacterium]|nr:hypothetical protein [Verrucomicrobiae bacterium]